MSESNEADNSPSPGEPEQSLSTVGWVPPPGAGRGAGLPKTPAVSTPKGGETELNTQLRPVEQVSVRPGSGFVLPPIPGYRVQRYVGRGGMGVVYQALHLATDRIVALKLINPGEVEDPVSRERFAREIHALAQLEHPNIVPIFDAGEWHGFQYFAMKFIPGGTLSQHLNRIRADLRLAVWLVTKVAHAVAALHGAGVLHRDLKPLNILLSDDDEPLVADFGLARWVNCESDLTNTGRPVGTRQYMSPEQTLGRREDYMPACDIWALGVVLYEVLTGERPFSDDGPMDLFHLIRFENPPPVASFAPSVPTELEAVALKCLAKRPEDRYASAAAVAADLERWLAGEAVMAELHAPAVKAPATAAPPAQKPVRRFRAILAVVAVAIFAVAAAWAGGVFRDRQPKVVEQEPKKTFAQRVAAGEMVYFTDEKGVPLVPWTPTPGHQLVEKGINGYHWFSSNGSGLVGLADEPWELPIRIKADIAVAFQSTQGTFGGIYVGRRLWLGPPSEHQSLLCFGISPQNAKEAPFAREMLCFEELRVWEREDRSAPYTFDSRVNPWDRGGKAEPIRFAPIVIDIREKEVRGSVDGHALKPVTEKMVLDDLLIKATQLPRFPAEAVLPPAFGTGMGIILQNADCVVRNLTVSKLNP